MATSTVYDVLGNGPAVVMVHGLGLNRRMWQWQREALQSEFSVIQYDLLGHGESPKPPGPYLMHHMILQIDELLDELGIAECAIVGFSLGGLIAQAYALAQPQKVSALAILHSAHARTEAQRDGIMERVRQAETDGPAATVDDALRRWFTESYAKANPERLALVRKWVTANDPTVYPALYRLLAEADIGLEETIADIRCPTLVVTGEEDYGNSPEMAERMAAIMPNARAEVLPGLRHLALAEDPQAMNALLLPFLIEHLRR